MKILQALLAGLVLFVGVSIAEAACTPEEAQQKAMAFATEAQAFAQKDPQKYAAAMQELQPQLLSVQQNPADVEAMCKFYDAALAKFK
ncbi:MAG: BTB/POZ domain-containing protein KCTD2 [Deltaproteobacteria bacterium]|jgi:hypothetical protein|nr:BTB/POZ domain-containing protein KCTD2 [Deltaproteobacteria bacterium]